MNILITGGTGFIGSNLIKHFSGRGHEIFYTGASEENKVEGTCIGKDFANLDWTDIRPNLLIHMAAITDTTVYDRSLMMKVNYSDSISLFGQALVNHCKNIVYASSCGVYGDAAEVFEESVTPKPLNVYAESKALLDSAAKKYVDYGINVIGLRFSNVYGPNERHKGKSASMVSRILWQMQEKNPTLFKYGEQKRDWVYYKDVVNAVALAAESKKSGVYNIGYGESVSFNDVVRLWNKTLGLKRYPEYIDNPFEGKYQSLTQVNIEKAKTILGYQSAYHLEKGMYDYINTAQV